MNAARRSNFNAESVSYGVVGSSLAPDLLAYTPRGFWASEHTAKIGTGRERFEAARELLWQWSVPLNSGIELQDVVPGSDDGYRGINRGELRQESDPNELLFTAQGFAYVNPGAQLSQRMRFGKSIIDAPARVVLVLDEDRRAGYALGTLEGHPLIGEEAFVLTHRDDDTVWFTFRVLAQLANPKLRLFTPLARLLHGRLAERYLQSLHPVAGVVQAERFAETDSDSRD